MGNAVYAEWMRQNMPDTATWHNDKHKGDVVEAILGAVWIITHAEAATWAGQVRHIQMQMEQSLKALWASMKKQEKSKWKKPGETRA